MVEVVILIIASRGKVYDELAKTWLKYMNKNPKIKCFFIYGNGPTLPEVKHQTIKAPFDENYIPGILDKTIYAYKWVLNNIKTNYILRTNLSSFFIFKKLLTRVATLPRMRCCCARFQYSTRHKTRFPTGDGILLTRDVVRKIVNNKHRLDANIIDDVSIGKYLETLNIKYVYNERTVLRPGRRADIGKSYQIRMKLVLASRPNLPAQLVKKYYG